MFEKLKDWAIGGVDFSVTKYAGEECIKYLDPSWRKIETFIILLACILIILWCSPKCNLPTIIYTDKDRVGRRLLLTIVCLCWGMEIGFKCASKTLIYLLNPCHVLTAIQIYLLTAAPSKIVTTVFRWHLNYLNGPLLAIIFYEIDTRLLPMETAVYWVQHGIIFVVSIYLLCIGGVYSVEKYKEFQWNLIAYSILIIYHFTVLQGVALLTTINMNHIMCPAATDPCRGQYYRTGMCFHQAILCIGLCKLNMYIAEKLKDVKIILDSVWAKFMGDRGVEQSEGSD